MINILVVDDDKNIRELISVVLKKEGFNIKKAVNGLEAIKIIENEKIDLAIVDIMMPIKDGYSLTKEVRRDYDIPILIITAKGESNDKLKGFNLGADDYLIKPFDILELVARVKAILRRYRVFSKDIVTLGDLILNYSENSLRLRDKIVNLPLKEFHVLFKMASFPGKIFTRNDLIEGIWGIDYEGDERTVDVHIKRIREKLELNNSNVNILTVRGLGYKVEVGE